MTSSIDFGRWGFVLDLLESPSKINGLNRLHFQAFKGQHQHQLLPPPPPLSSYQLNENARLRFPLKKGIQTITEDYCCQKIVRIYLRGDAQSQIEEWDPARRILLLSKVDLLSCSFQNRLFFFELSNAVKRKQRCRKVQRKKISPVLYYIIKWCVKPVRKCLTQDTFFPFKNNGSVKKKSPVPDIRVFQLVVAARWKVSEAFAITSWLE